MNLFVLDHFFSHSYQHKRHVMISTSDVITKDIPTILSPALFGGSAITFFFLVGLGVCGIAVIVGDRLGLLDGGGLV